MYNCHLCGSYYDINKNRVHLRRSTDQPVPVFAIYQWECQGCREKKEGMRAMKRRKDDA